MIAEKKLRFLKIVKIITLSTFIISSLLGIWAFLAGFGDIPFFYNIQQGDEIIDFIFLFFLSTFYAIFIIGRIILAANESLKINWLIRILIAISSIIIFVDIFALLSMCLLRDFHF